MEEEFDILKSIKRVETPEYLFDNILKRVYLKKLSTINIGWVRSAAAILIFMISLEVYWVRDSFIQKEKNTLQSLIPTNNNMLY